MGRWHLRLPTWVVLPQAVVEAVEQTTLEWSAATSAPGPVTSWSALQWVGAVDGVRTPLTNVHRAATWERAVTEFHVAAAIMDGEQYPPAAWFVEVGLPADEAPTPGWWESYARWGYGRAAGLGAVAALGWLLGVMPDPTSMVGSMYEDGSEIPAAVRQEWGSLLLGRIRAAQPGPYLGPGGEQWPDGPPALETVRPAHTYPSASPSSN